MRVNRYNFLVVVGLAIMLGVTTAFGASDDSGRKRPKDMGSLTVKTSEESYPVIIDGKERGMSGVGTAAEFYLSPGFHTVEVRGPDGKIWKDEIEIRRGSKHCICLKIVRETINRPCPYNFHLEGPDRIMEGDLVTFAAINSGTAPIPIRFAWSVSPSDVRISNGEGTPTLTVDSTGIGGRTIGAELDVNDDVYDNTCRQLLSVPTEVTKIPPPPEPKAFICDEFIANAPDDDKARFDNCVIQAQNTPDSQIYVIIYPGTDKASVTRNSYDRLQKRTLDYMVGTRGFDPKRISIVRGINRTKTTYQVWIVPPGAEPPVSQ